SDARWDAAAIRQMLSRALEGAGQIEARPVKASLEPGETPSLRGNALRPRAGDGEPPPGAAHIAVTSDAGAVVFEGNVALAGTAELRSGLLTFTPTTKLEPGLYHARVTVPDAPFHPNATTTGFWVKEARVLASGPRIAVSRDWLRRDGAVMPVVGTAYMGSDAPRTFL